MSGALHRIACAGICLGGCFLATPGRGQELPVKGTKEDLEADATRLLNDLPTLTDPANTAAAEGPAVTLEQARTRLAQAQRKLQRWEKLFKDGVLSRSEVERCTVELADALDRYTHANLAELQRELASAKERVAKGTADQAMVDAAAAAIESTQLAVAKADAQLFQTKFDLAKVNLERQRRLYAEKLISRAGLQEAEALVQRLAEQKPAQE